MAQPYDSGACFLYAGIGANLAPVFVGTGERAPRQRVQRFWSQVFNDLAGDQDSFDDMYQGQRGMVLIRLTMWNQAVVTAMQSTPFAPGAAGVPGFDAVGDVGTLMMTEQCLFPLWVLYDYGAAGRFPKAAMTGGSMPPGRRWFGARLESPDDEQKGTQANFTDLVFTCKRVYVPSSGGASNYATTLGINGLGVGALGLYDTNMNGLPAPV